MDIKWELERFRYALFMGQLPASFSPRTQEEYIEYYESRTERDPVMERRLLADASSSILPVYRKKLEDMARMERLISGSEEPVAFSDEEVLEELYDEVANMETEEEWQEFLKTYT